MPLLSSMTDQHKVHFGERLSRQQELRRSLMTSGPGILWVTVFLLLPLVGIVAISFASHGTYGDVQWKFTLDNFKRFIGFGLFGFDPLYPKIIARSLAMAMGTTVLCIFAALP